jgi:hypothetical protein
MTSAVLSGILAASVAALRLALAFILAEAAVNALRDRAVFAAIIEDYAIIPGAASASVAIIVPLFELISASLLLGPTVKVGAVCAVGLLGGFACAMSINLWRGRNEISCGCGGGASLPISPALILRNTVLVAASTAILLQPAGSGTPAQWTAGLGFAAFLVALYFAANQLIGNARALATRRASGAPA